MFHGLIALAASVLLVLPGTWATLEAEGDRLATTWTPVEPAGAAAVKGPTWGLPTPAPEAAFDRSGPIFPATVEQANADDPPYYDDGCHVPPAGTAPGGPSCVFGDPRGAVDVWVVGDSKIGQWFSALDTIAKREGWRLTVHTKSACPFAPPLAMPGNPNCEAYNDNLDDLLTQARPDVVLTASGKGGTAVRDAYVETWRKLRANGTQRVVAMWDSPGPGLQLPACIEPLVPYGDYVEGCTWQPRVSATPTLRAAAEQVDGATYVDMADWVCPPSTLSPGCPPVIGQALIYRAGSHLTDTYVGSLTDALHERLYRAGVAARPPEPERVERIGGRDRYDTAAQLSVGYPTRRPVIVTSGQNFPDALSAAARAGDTGIPVLLTHATTLPAPTLQALQRLRPSSITVVGGEAAVSAEVENALARLTTGRVDRVFGPNRYATSAAVAQLSSPPLPVVYVATGASFPDALAAAARAGHEGVPVLLTTKDALPPSTAEVLVALQPEEVTVVGGENVVGEAVLHELRSIATTGRVDRISGPDRYATAARLTGTYPTAIDTVYVATATNYPDALSAAARAGREDAPVLLVSGQTIPEATAQALERLAPRRIVVVGAAGVLSDEVRWGLERYLR